MEVVIARGFHGMGLFEESFGHRLIDKTRADSWFSGVWAKDAQQTNGTFQVFIFLTQFQFDVVVIIIWQQELGHKESRSVFGLEVQDKDLN